MFRPFHRLLFTLALCAGWAGCVGTGSPLPPGIDPIDPANVSTTAEIDMPSVMGAPGSVLAEGAEVLVWNLENALPPGRGPVAVDGSFDIRLEFTASDELRLQVRTASDRSPPTDIATGGTVRNDCLEVPFELPLGGDRVGELMIENVCAFNVTVDNIVLRVGEPALVITAPATADLPPGSRLDVGVRADGISPVEDILFVHATLEGEVARYPITLFVLDP